MYSGNWRFIDFVRFWKNIVIKTFVDGPFDNDATSPSVLFSPGSNSFGAFAGWNWDNGMLGLLSAELLHADDCELFKKQNFSFDFVDH